MIDQFGFLNYKTVIEFENGKIAPIPEFDKVKEEVFEYTHADGFIYPPMCVKVEIDFVTGKQKRKIPKTRRPALLHKIPVSHEININTTELGEEFRIGKGAFIIHLLAYLFGTRLQFQGWWFDSRIPIRSQHNICFKPDTVNDFISHCYKTWQIWTPEDQKLITNILFMHCRAVSYEWDWEQFIIEYMVLDACYKLANNIYRVHANKHSGRIEKLCEKFNIPFENNLVRKIVNERNKLFHETLWVSSQPCASPGSSSPYHLRRLNNRIIPAILGYNTPYIKTKWWCLGTFGFDKPIKTAPL